ncbi:MAG: cupredoxin domain-containing protein [bacterium]
MSHRGRARHVSLVILQGVLFLMAGCARKPAGQAPGQPAAGPGRVVEVRLVGTEFKWNPRTVTVTQGQRVRFRVVNAGAIEHTFVSDQAKIPETKSIAPGEEFVVEWTAPQKPGSLPFWCGVPGHREAGMEGTIIVK